MNTKQKLENSLDLFGKEVDTKNNGYYSPLGTISD